MPAPKQPENYPTAYVDLVAAVHAAGRTVQVIMPDAAAAIRLRFKFYSWRKTLEGREEHAETLALAKSIIVQLTHAADQSFVTFSSVDDSDESGAILAAIEKARNSA